MNSVFGKSYLQQIIEGSVSYRQRNAFARGKSVKFLIWVTNNFTNVGSVWKDKEGKTVLPQSLYDKFLQSEPNA